MYQWQTKIKDYGKISAVNEIIKKKSQRKSQAHILPFQLTRKFLDHKEIRKKTTAGLNTPK